MFCPSHPPWYDNLDTWTIFGKACMLQSSSSCTFHLPVTSLFGPNIILSTVLSNTISLCYFNFFFLKRRQENYRLWTKW
jgi:hypothetical protein